MIRTTAAMMNQLRSFVETGWSSAKVPHWRLCCWNSSASCRNSVRRDILTDWLANNRRPNNRPLIHTPVYGALSRSDRGRAVCCGYFLDLRERAVVESNDVNCNFFVVEHVVQLDVHEIAGCYVLSRRDHFEFGVSQFHYRKMISHWA